jgi:hypothetical protein
MKNKRYSIVRVDIYNPCCLENIECKVDAEICHKGKCPYNYGDTKEQLIKKVAQKIFEDENRTWVDTFGEEYLLKKYINMNKEKSLKLAKEIIEFLGVEE